VPKIWEILPPGSAVLDSFGIGREGDNTIRTCSIIEHAFDDKFFHVATGLTMADALDIVERHNKEIK
jgi:hypothetical protein